MPSSTPPDVMLYDIIFLNSHRDADHIWLPNPKVGDAIKVNMLTDDELEYWTITNIQGNCLTVEKQ